jgi:hypothetical protein
LGNDIADNLKVFCREFGIEQRKAGEVAARPPYARDQADLHRIAAAEPLGSGHRKKERSAPSLRADQLIDKGAIIGE